MTKLKTKKLVLSAMFLALCMVLPFLTGQIPQIGSMLLPIHLPVLLCGFICGWPWGLAVGIIAPILRSSIFTMPPMFPGAVSMAFEMGVYGLVCGLLYRYLPRKKPYVIVTLLTAMICGRVAWGVVRVAISFSSASAFTWKAFIAGAVTNAIPGIILQIVLVPIIIYSLERFKLIPLDGHGRSKAST